MVHKVETAELCRDASNSALLGDAWTVHNVNGMPFHPARQTATLGRMSLMFHINLSIAKTIIWLCNPVILLQE